jgi:ABC-type nitrate/sulfonate/bicarbonate transport system substrate-binding protein
MTRRPLLARCIALLGVMALVPACSSGTSGGGTTGPPADAAGSLAGVCPDPVVFQTDWNPESEHGQLYELVGDGYRVDAGRLRVTGPLVAGGRDTGIDVEIRAGGPAIGNQTVTSQLYQDPDILLGYVSTDEAILNSGDFPTKAVVAPLAINPQIIMWDPATYPQVKSIKDLKSLGVKVRYFLGASYMDYLIESGQLDRSQVDGSYDGTPANFVAAGGRDAQQGFASSEPYFYEKVLKDWGKPVAYQLIHDAGWTGYTQSLAATRDSFAAHTACFERLVPIIQQAQVDYIRDPAKANSLIVDLVNQYDNGWQYDEAQAEASVQLQLQNGLVANSADGTLGSFDLDRVRRFLATAIPIYEAAGARLAPDLRVDDLVTNEFIDPSIAL